MEITTEEIYDYQDLSIMLMERAIALRGKFFEGCGFLNCIISRAAACVRSFHNLDEFPFHDGRLVRIRLQAVQRLADELTKAEVSANHYEVQNESE